MVAEIIAGITLCNSAYKAIKESISNCKEVGQIAGHIDNLIDGKSQIDKGLDGVPTSAVGQKWQSFLGKKIGNANPLSVKNAINSFDAIKKEKSKKYLILGDMLELGRNSENYHKDLSKVINKSNIDKVFIKGEKTLFTYKNLHKSKQGNILQNKDDIDLILSKIINNNDYLMIKGSNATGLNVLSKKIIRGSNVI